MKSKEFNKKVLITPDNYIGTEEWYLKVIECPKCKTKNPIKAKYCNSCGVEFKLSTTVQGFSKNNNIL